MTIKDVKKIPTRYRAVQWTGKEEDEIRELMEGINGYAYVSNEDPDYSYVYTYDKKGVGKDTYLTLGCWIVMSTKGRVEVLTEDAYKEKYEDK